MVINPQKKKKTTTPLLLMVSVSPWICLLFHCTLEVWKITCVSLVLYHKQIPSLYSLIPISLFLFFVFLFICPWLMMNGRNRFPFTPSQWQELELQALIYKYMASGVSIPPDLLFTIKRSHLDTPLSSRLLPHQSQHCKSSSFYHLMSFSLLRRLKWVWKWVQI